jgi:hypothetical protein
MISAFSGSIFGMKLPYECRDSGSDLISILIKNVQLKVKKKRLYRVDRWAEICKLLTKKTRFELKADLLA